MLGTPFHGGLLHFLAENGYLGGRMDTLTTDGLIQALTFASRVSACPQFPNVCGIVRVAPDSFRRCPVGQVHGAAQSIHSRCVVGPAELYA